MKCDTSLTFRFQWLLPRKRPPNKRLGSSLRRERRRVRHGFIGWPGNAEVCVMVSNCGCYRRTMSLAMNWDTSVTLAFAAEQSLAAAQLLTSDKIAPLDALRLSYDEHISSLLTHTHFLPIGITARLRNARSKYARALAAVSECFLRLSLKWCPLPLTRAGERL
jgi:hypothetical protein